jgi:alpha-galactosidase/6-phospho-beta-glucosidase family protein
MEKYVEDAEKIWKDFKQRCKDPSFATLTGDMRVDFYQKNHMEFARLFPIVLRYMVQFGVFKTKCFKQLIERMRKHPYRSKDEFCERQADYVKYLCLECKERCSIKDANIVWKQVYDSLKKETDAFTEADRIMEEESKKKEKQNNIEKRKELKELMVNLHINERCKNHHR